MSCFDKQHMLLIHRLQRFRHTDALQLASHYKVDKPGKQQGQQQTVHIALRKDPNIKSNLIHFDL